MYMQATLVHSLFLWLGQWVSNCIQNAVYISSLLVSFSGVIQYTACMQVKICGPFARVRSMNFQVALDTSQMILSV